MTLNRRCRPHPGGISVHSCHQILRTVSMLWITCILTMCEQDTTLLKHYQRGKSSEFGKIGKIFGSRELGGGFFTTSLAKVGAEGATQQNGQIPRWRFGLVCFPRRPARVGGEMGILLTRSAREEPNSAATKRPDPSLALRVSIPSASEGPEHSGANAPDSSLALRVRIQTGGRSATLRIGLRETRNTYPR